MVGGFLAVLLTKASAQAAYTANPNFTEVSEEMKGLTDKQRKILDFIEEFMDDNSMAPTVYEIADNFKIKTSTVFAHLRALQRKKFLTRSSKARSISLNKPHHKRGKKGSFALPVPLLGKIAAGTPMAGGFSQRKEGEVYCDPSLIGAEVDRKSLFALKIQGQSMRDVGILDGDVIVAKRAESAKSGDIVVAMIGGETTVKSYHPLRDDALELRPANPDFKTKTFSKGEVDIQGVVVALHRKF